LDFKAPKGTSDMLPDLAEKKLYLEEIATKKFDIYGYRPIITPLFEHTEVFDRGIGKATDIVQKEMYTFTDKAGRNLSLRPEGTAPVVRAYLEHNLNRLSQPLKLYYLGPMFRYERPQAGRYRQFWQIGVEAIGSAEPTLDTEVIILLLDILQVFGLKQLKLYLNSMGCEKCRPNYAKLLKEYAEPLADKLCSDCRKRLKLNPLRLFDCKNRNCITILNGAPKLLDYLDNECQRHFTEVKALLDLLEINFEINSKLVRGLDYYTRTTFEVVSEKLGAQNALGGGGRYDRLVEVFGGPPTPAIGFALGTDRVLIAAEKEQIEIPVNNKLQIFIAVLEKEARYHAVKLLHNLRRRGIKAETDYLSRSLKAQLKLADKLGAKFTIMIGPDELEKRELLIRNMETGAQFNIAFGKVDDWLESLKI
jgi:histidyl-tRNA synthetase